MWIRKKIVLGLSKQMGVNCNGTSPLFIIIRITTLITLTIAITLVTSGSCSTPIPQRYETWSWRTSWRRCDTPVLQQRVTAWRDELYGRHESRDKLYGRHESCDKLYGCHLTNCTCVTWQTVWMSHVTWWAIRVTRITWHFRDSLPQPTDLHITQLRPWLCVTDLQIYFYGNISQYSLFSGNRFNVTQCCLPSVWCNKWNQSNFLLYYVLQMYQILHKWWRTMMLFFPQILPVLLLKA